MHLTETSKLPAKRVADNHVYRMGLCHRVRAVHKQLRRMQGGIQHTRHMYLNNGTYQI
jgi:hypothetical protein